MTSEAALQTLNIEVAIALPERQEVISLEVPQGTTAEGAVVLANLQEKFPTLDIAGAPLGVWCRQVDRQHVLHDGDRVEVYRSLLMDPREARRQLAARGKVMGKAGLARDRD